MIQNSSCKGCLWSHANSVVKYQNQQRIWKTVRVDSSQYTMNKASLNTYEPSWNQQSDRSYPHIQPAVPSHGNSTKRTITRARPGACAPGGIGCDIKFNSYVRYLNRLKGKSVLRRGPITSEAIENSSFPMRGGKYYKTNIISSCRCGDKLEPTQGEFISSIESRLLNIGDLIAWGCNYGIIIDRLENGYVLIQKLDKYGDEKNIDILNLGLQNVEKIDSCFFEKKDILVGAQQYFNHSLNSLDSICSP